MPQHSHECRQAFQLLSFQTADAAALGLSLFLTFWFILEYMIKVKEKSEKAGLKLNIQKMKIMASGPITSWEIDGETVETVSDFIFWAPKSLQMVTAAMKLKDAYCLKEKSWAT